jgi:hypothetical protein
MEGEELAKGATGGDGETPGLTTVTVRSTGFRRYRAGLGPFGREPVTVRVTPEQLLALRADTLLIVNED